MSYQPRRKLEKERNRLIAEGWYKEDQLQIIKHNMKTNWLTGIRKLSNKYSFIPLHFMCEYAIKHKMKLPFEKTALEDEYSVKTNILLQDMKQRLHEYVFENKPPLKFKYLYPLYLEYKDSKIPEQRYADYQKELKEQEQLRKLRNEYFHWSANYKGFGMEPNMEDGKRKRVHYPN